MVSARFLALLSVQGMAVFTQAVAADINSELHSVVEAGDVAEVKRLIAAGADVNIDPPVERFDSSLAFLCAAGSRDPISACQALR